MWAELTLQEPLGAELVGFGIEILSTVDQVRAWAEDDPGRVFPTSCRKRLHRLPHNEGHHRAFPQALANRRIEVFQGGQVLGLGRR